MSRRYNPQRAKLNRTYLVKELAKLFKVGVGTVSAWVADGLKPCDRSRPYLFRGEDIRAYMERRTARAKRPCGPGEIYCVACKAVRVPANQQAWYRPVCAKSGNLFGACPVCKRWIFRRVSRASVDDISGNLDIRYEDLPVHINACTSRPHTGRKPANG